MTKLVQFTASFDKYFKNDIALLADNVADTTVQKGKGVYYSFPEVKVKKVVDPKTTEQSGDVPPVQVQK